MNFTTPKPTLTPDELGAIRYALVRQIPAIRDHAPVITTNYGDLPQLDATERAALAALLERLLNKRLKKAGAQ